MFENLDYIFTEEVTQEIPKDLITGVLEIFKIFNNTREKKVQDIPTSLVYYHSYLYLYNFIKYNNEDPGQIFKNDVPHENLIKNITSYLNNQFSKYSALNINRERSKIADQIELNIAGKFDNDYYYELKDEELKKIQELSSKIRDLITKSKFYEESHKSWLLKILGNLDSELYKTMTSFDRVYALFFETRMIFENIKETKPVFELVLEMSKIIMEVVSLKNGLPPGTVNNILKG